MERILIIGGSGFIGQKLNSHFTNLGYRVNILSRNINARGSETFYWNPATGQIDPEALQSDILINLAGAGIADKRWTKSRKEKIITSRVESTDFLIWSMIKDGLRCKTFINASAVGYYGDTGGKWVSEESLPISNDFLSQVCQQWEEAANKSKDVANRSLILRVGTVLDRKAGALPKMLGPIRYGVANYLGSGDQYISWIHIEDLCRMIQFVIENDNIQGTLNAVAPVPLTNKAFTEELKNKLNPRALIVPVPSCFLKILLGEMAALVLNSSRVSTHKILNAGFEFNYPTAKEAISYIYS